MKITCKGCGKEHEKERPGQKYCSEYCAEKYRYLRAANRRVVHPYKVFERDNFKCIYCGESSIKHGTKLQCDHIIPINEGGEDVMTNMVSSCMPCNASKNKIRLQPETEKMVLDIIKKRTEKYLVNKTSTLNNF